MKNNYEIILFDLDNTLFDFDIDQKKAYYGAIDSIGYILDDRMYKKYCEINEFMWHMLNDGMMGLEEVFVRRHERFFDIYGIDYSPKDFDNLLTLHFQKTGTTIKGVIELLEKLKYYYVLVVASNGPKDQQYHRLKNSGLMDYFEKIFISEEVGYNKPELEFYQNIFDSMNVYDKSKYLMVGDSISSDILGGINAGIDTCWYNPKRKSKRLRISPTYEIQNISKVGDILGK